MNDRMRTVIALCLALLPTSAYAVNVEPGSLWGSFGLGPGFKLGTELGGSKAYALLDGDVNYSFTENLSVDGELTLGLANTIPWRWRLGGRYRFSDLKMPVSPYVLAQFSTGVLFDVIGANLWVVGGRFGGGADYFLTADIGVGAQLTFDLGSTLGQRPAFYGTSEILAYASYRFK